MMLLFDTNLLYSNISSVISFVKIGESTLSIAVDVVE